MRLNSAGTMKPTLSLDVSGMSEFWGKKVSKRDCFLIDLNCSAPLSVVKGNAKIPALCPALGYPLILKVFRFCNISQVRNPVVIPNTVDVVNLSNRPIPVGYEPSQTMGRMGCFSKLNSTITLVINRTCDITSFDGVDRGNNPAKDSSFWRIAKLRLDSINRYFTVFGFNMPSKVCNSIIRIVVINPNYFSYNWKNPMNIQPSKRVTVKRSVINTNGGVSFAINSSSLFAHGFIKPAIYSPSKQSSNRVVVKKLFESFLREGIILFSHAVSPVKKWFGKKPACVISTCGLRHFNLGGI